MTGIKSYRDLVAWQKGMELCRKVYEATKTFPREEMFGLTQQVRRAAVSVPANIAEGWGRGSLADYVRFLRTARGSLCEVETEILICRELRYLPEPEAAEVLEACAVCSRVLHGLIASLVKGL
jgi:four helix bundle protein